MFSSVSVVCFYYGCFSVSVIVMDGVSYDMNCGLLILLVMIRVSVSMNVLCSMKFLCSMLFD